MYIFTKKTKLTEKEELKFKIEELKSQLYHYDKTIYELRVKIAKEINNRKAIINFIDKTCVKRLNEDGTTTHTLTSFVPDLSRLLITREDLGIDGEF